MNRLHACAAVVLALVTAGCISTRSFVASELPTAPKATAAELKAGDAVVKLDLDFTTNGKPNARATEFVRKKVVERMAALGVAKVAAGPADPSQCTMRIHMDNVANTGESFGKGFKTGLTFGLAGSTVTDGYVFDGTVECAGKPPVQRSYKHLITSVVGRGEGPAGLPPLTLEQAIGTVIDDLLITLLRDAQHDGVLVAPAVPAST